MRPFASFLVVPFLLFLALCVVVTILVAIDSRRRRPKMPVNIGEDVVLHLRTVSRDFVRYSSADDSFILFIARDKPGGFSGKGEPPDEIRISIWALIDGIVF